MRKTGKNSPTGGSSGSGGEEGDESAGSGGNRTFVGSLLVAHPSLRDPNFRRAVLYLTAHTAEAGAFGLILNRPLGRTAAEVLPNHDAQEVLARVPVYLGGPVGQDQLSFAEVGWTNDPARAGKGALKFRHNLSLEEVGGLLADEHDVAGGSPHSARRLRAIVGYAGWGGGQLEGEIEQNAWVLVKPQRRFFDPPPAVEEKLWFGIMSSLGPAFKLLAAAPDDPSLN